MPSTYLVQCADGSYYCGSTWDLHRRLLEHNEGIGCAYTRPVRRRPVVLMWHREFDSVAAAFALEKQIQNWSRAKRQALIDGRIDDIGLLGGRSFASQDAREAVRGHALLEDDLGEAPDEG